MTFAVRSDQNYPLIGIQLAEQGMRQQMIVQIILCFFNPLFSFVSLRIERFKSGSRTFILANRLKKFRCLHLFGTVSHYADEIFRASVLYLRPLGTIRRLLLKLLYPSNYSSFGYGNVFQTLCY